MVDRKVGKKIARALLSSSALIVTAVVPVHAAMAAQAKDAATINLNIPAQDLGSALSEFARQSRQQLLYAPELAKGKTSATVSGSMSPEAGLRQLLSGTDLHVSTSSSGAFVLSTAKNASSVEFGDATDATQGSEGISEILVVGSRSQNVDIRRTEDDAQPYVVFKQEDIQKSGAANLNEFLQTRLPMNANSLADAASGVNTTAAGLGGSINLRGLGVRQTLILVDGRRAPETPIPNATTDFSQASIRGIPLSSVERIEILPATGGGIYGGSATGGVVNIILKRNYNGIDLEASYDNTSDFVLPSLALSVNGGLAMENGKTRITFRASRRRAGHFNTSDRNELAVLTRDLLLTNNPAGFSGPFPYSYTPSICATASAASTTCAPTSLTLRDPTALPLNSNHTFVPIGYPGPLDGGRAFIANAGRYNLDISPTYAGLGGGVAYPDTDAYAAGVRRSFGPSVDVFLDIARTKSVSSSLAGTLAVNLNIPSTLTSNPFNQNILVSLIGPRTPIANDIKTTNIRAGVIAKLPQKWKGVLELGQSTSGWKSQSVFVSTLTATGRAYLQSVALRDPNEFPYENYLSLFNRQAITTTLKSTTREISLRLGGPLISLPQGPVVMNTLLEYRKVDSGDYFDERIAVPANTVATEWTPSILQKNATAYGEILVPLLKGLDLTGAFRHDEYKLSAPAQFSISGIQEDGPFPKVSYNNKELHSTDVTLAASYSPVPDLTLRASYSTGFLPPTISQITPRAPFMTPSASSLDPKRNNTPLSTPFSVISGGNLSLLPENSKNFSVGAILRPRFVDGLRFSVDYVRIDKQDEIGSFSLGNLLLNEDVVPGRIIRAPLTPEDIALGYAGGSITGIDLSLINISWTKVRSLDFQADYDLKSRIGDWHVYLIGSRNLKRANQTIPSIAPVDNVGFAGGPLKWKINGGFDWGKGPLTLGWNAQYYHGRDLCLATAILSTGGTASCNTTKLNNGRSRISSQIFFDANAVYKLDELGIRFLKDAELALVVRNLFNKRPQMIADTAISYAEPGDILMRRFTLTLRKHFGWK